FVIRQTRNFHDGTNFDSAESCDRNAFSDLDRFVEIVRIDQVIAAELFVGLCEWAIGDESFAVADPDAGSRRGWMQWRSIQIFPAGMNLPSQLCGFDVTVLTLRFA